MNDHDDTPLDDEDEGQAALYRQWHRQRPLERGLDGARRRLSDELVGTASDGTTPGEPRSPEALYRRYREQRMVTPPQTIEAILSAVQEDAVAQRAGVQRVAEAAPHDERAANHVPALHEHASLSRLFTLPGRLLDSATQALGGLASPGPMRRALPALALAGAALVVAPLLLTDRGADLAPATTTVASVPVELLDQAASLAEGVQAVESTGLGLSGSDRQSVAFNVGTTVTDLVVLVHAERSPAIERSLDRVRARLERLTGLLGDETITAAAAKLDAGAMRMPDEALRPALDTASDSLRDSLADSPAVGVRYDLGGTLAFIELAASLDSGALQGQAFEAAFDRLGSVTAQASENLAPDAAEELRSLLALGERTGGVPRDEVLRHVARLRLLLG